MVIFSSYYWENRFYIKTFSAKKSVIKIKSKICLSTGKVLQKCFVKPEYYGMRGKGGKKSIININLMRIYIKLAI